MMELERQADDVRDIKRAFAQLLDALPDAVVVTTTDGRIMAVNENLCQMAGYTADAIIGRPIEALVPRDLRAQHVALRTAYVAEDLAARGLSSRSGIMLLRSDGTELPVDVALSRMPYERDQVVVASVRDATVRRAGEIRAERERAFLTAMNDVSNTLHSTTDSDATLRLVTERARVLLDADFAILVAPDPGDDGMLVVRAADGQIGEPLFGTRLPPEDAKLGWSIRHDDITLVIDGSTDPRLFRPPLWPKGIGATLVVPLRAREETIGSLVIAKLSGLPMFEPADIAFIRAFATHATLAITFGRTQEIEERSHLLEIAAARSESQLRLQHQVVERLEELGRQKSDFVSRISHELRTPLSSILGFVEVLIDGEPGETTQEQNEMLAIVERNGRRLLTLIEDLLMISRVEAGGFAIEPRRFDLGDAIANALEIIGPALAAADVELTVALGPDAWLVADRDQIERGLVNLVSNAVKFTPPLGRISIESTTADGEITISVSDSGCGIPADEQAQLFTRFFRGVGARTGEVPGTGLGLYILKEIVTRHGGTVAAVSTPKGSTFTVRLPVDGRTPVVASATGGGARRGELRA
jgi:PAS domain S-box-containing protein